MLLNDGIDYFQNDNELHLFTSDVIVKQVTDNPNFAGHSPKAVLNLSVLRNT
jgi:hypothetical protein